MNAVDLFSVGPSVIFAEARRSEEAAWVQCEFLRVDLAQAPQIRLTLTFAAEKAVVVTSPHIIIH